MFGGAVALIIARKAVGIGMMMTEEVFNPSFVKDKVAKGKPILVGVALASLVGTLALKVCSTVDAVKNAKPNAGKS